jgi:nucleoid-associated protein Lsr2
MAQKVTVALEDDLDGGLADESVRFGLGGVEYEIDLSKRTPGRSVSSSRLSSSTPARLAGDSAAGPGVPQHAGSAAAISGRGRKARASRSATADASPPASLSSTKPPPKAPDSRWYSVGLNRPLQVVSGP